MSYKVSHVRLLVNNFAECFRFYSDVLGMESHAGDETGPYAEFLADGRLIVALFRRDYMAQVVGQVEASGEDLPIPVSHPTASVDASTGQKSLSDEQDAAGTFVQDRAALVIDVADVDQLAAQLQKKGVVLVNEPMNMEQWVLRVAHFRDPAGNLIEINQSLA